MKNFVDLLRSLSALDMLRVRDTTRTDEKHYGHRRNKTEPRKDEYLTLLLKHTVKLGVSLVPTSLVTKRSVNRELREADFPVRSEGKRAKHTNALSYSELLHHFTPPADVD